MVFSMHGLHIMLIRVVNLSPRVVWVYKEECFFFGIQEVLEGGESSYFSPSMLRRKSKEVIISLSNLHLLLILYKF